MGQLILAIVCGYFGIDMKDDGSDVIGNLFLIGAAVLFLLAGSSFGFRACEEALPKRGEIDEEELDFAVDFVMKNTKDAVFQPGGLLVTREWLHALIKYAMMRFTILDKSIVYKKDT